MKRMFITDGNFEKSYSRDRARGHKSLVIDDSIQSGSYIQFVTGDNDSLIMKESEITAEDDSNEEVYTILCKEFGLFGKYAGVSAEVSIIYLDNGYMLVTLWKGAIICYLNDELVLPNVDCGDLPNFTNDEIFWVNAEHMLSYSKYMDSKQHFMYDFEFSYILSGDIRSGLSNFGYKHIDEEDIDLSLGYFAQYEQEVVAKAEAKKASQLTKLFTPVSGSMQLEFEDDDYEDDEDEFEEDDEEEDFDDEY